MLWHRNIAPRPAFRLTVLDDDAVDHLTGDAGFDWFLLDLTLPAPIDAVIDLAAVEEVN